MNNPERQELTVSDRSSDEVELEGDERLFQLLVSGAHVENAATAAGVSERTAYRRLADPGFRKRLDDARQSLREAILGRLVDAGNDAIGVLWDLMNYSEDENIKLKASKTLLDSLMGSHAMLPKTKTTVRTTIEKSETSEA